MELIDKYKALKLLEIKGYSISDMYENKELIQACHKGMGIAYNVIYEMKAIPLPQKKDTHGRYIDNQYIETAYEVGWNDCIDEILGVKKE